MAGGLDYLLRQASQYATERRQFGKPIGSFQVIQQNLAVLAGHTAAAGTAAANAFRAADRGDAAFEIAVAKVRVGEAAGIGAQIAHQVHGAIGFTYEHALQFATRRLGRGARVRRRGRVGGGARTGSRRARRRRALART
jgi:acyl-CoA dehydrogenase